MKATSLLEKQHKKVQAALKKLASGRADSRTLLVEIANDLTAHMAIEQEIFYPAVQKVDPDMILEAYEEHAMAELALKRLLATDPEDVTFKARATVLKELIGHHVDEEEEDLLPRSEKALGPERNEALGQQMKVAFEAAVERGYAAALPRGSKTTADADERRVLTNGHAR